ncbi:MAG: hypothetical protein E3K36_11705 [Candidatus Brocadia sp.]|nr:hypothetical protein [Candidatus Brocadia sp.]
MEESGLLGTEGITDCNLSTGVAEYKIFNKECTKPCTIEHEEVHKAATRLNVAKRRAGAEINSARQICPVLI